MSDKKTVGRFEKVDLPELSLFTLDAKIDTGADSSALHCHDIQVDEEAKTVTFNLLDPSHPDYHEKRITLPVTRKRTVRSSNGMQELRVYVTTTIVLLGESFEIEMSLTDRSTMRFPMLIGRKFLHNRFLVDVSKTMETEEGRVKVGILSLGPELYSTRRLYEEAKKRGWDAEVIKYLNCATAMEQGKLAINYKGRDLSDLDAVIPRIGASRTFFGTAVVRQFELMNIYAANASLAISRSRDKLRSLQILAKHGVDMPRTLFAAKVEDVEDIIQAVGGTPLIIKMIEGTQGVGVVLAETHKAAKSVLEAFYGVKVNLLLQEFIEEAGGADIRAFVVDGKVVAAMKRQGAEGDFRSNIHRGGSAVTIKLSRAERDLAVKAAKVMGLSVAGVDMLQSSRGPMIMEVNSSPGLEGIETTTKVNVAGEILDMIARHLQATTPRQGDRIGS